MYSGNDIFNSSLLVLITLSAHDEHENCVLSFLPVLPSIELLYEWWLPESSCWLRSPWSRRTGSPWWFVNCSMFIIKSKLVSVCILCESPNMICVGLTQMIVIACTKWSLTIPPEVQDQNEKKRIAVKQSFFSTKKLPVGWACFFSSFWYWKWGGQVKK